MQQLIFKVFVSLDYQINHELLQDNLKQQSTGLIVHNCQTHVSLLSACKDCVVNLETESIFNARQLSAEARKGTCMTVSAIQAAKMSFSSGHPRLADLVTCP